MSDQVRASAGAATSARDSGGDTGVTHTIERPPAWFDLLALAGPVLMAVVGSVGLVAAMAGAYSWWLALGLGGPVAALMLYGAWRVRGADDPADDPADEPAVAGFRAPHLAAAAAVLLAVGYFVFAASTPSQNVIATRDPGVYQNSARWLSREGDLDADGPAGAFEGIEGLRYESAGVYDMGDGEVEFQFNHLSSVVMSVAYDLGGQRALFRMPALAAAAGLLALYAVAVRVTGRPVISLVAPAVFAVSMPLLFVARNTYSEPFALALLWAAVVVGADLHRRPRHTTALIGGALLGAVVSTRVDAMLYVALVFPLAALSVMASADDEGRRARIRAWLVMVVATAAFAAIGIVDLLVWTGRYANDLGPQIRSLRMVVGAAALVSAGAVVAWRVIPVARRVYERIRRPLAAVAAGTVVAGLLAGWLVRPMLQTVRGTFVFESVRNIQRSDGVAEDATRTFAEHSMHWMGWYLGEVTLVAAIVGFGVVAFLGIRSGKVRPAAVGVFILTLAGGALYWWNPSITPDHLWATRRFVPAVLPGLAVLAVVPLAAFWGLGKVDRRVRTAVLCLLTAAILVPPAMTTWPLRWQRSQYGYLLPVTELCELLPEDAAVVVLGGYGGATLPQSLRSWCGVPVAAQGTAVNDVTVEDVAAQVRSNGYRLVLVGADSRDLTGYVPIVGGTPQHTNSAADHWLVRSTVDRPPSEYIDFARSLPVEVPFRLHMLVVDDEQP